MDDRDLGWIKESTRFEAAGRNKVAQLLAAKCEIEASRCSAKRSIGRPHAARGSTLSQAGARRDFDHQACLVPKLRRRRSGNHFQRLNGFHRDLVGKNLALLIRDWLSVDGKRIFRMIPEPVEKPVGIRHYARRSKRHQ